MRAGTDANLALLANREEEIHSFTPKSYYGVRLYSEGICFTWQDQKSGSTRIFDGERAKKITEMIQGERLLLERVEKKKKHTYAPALYDLTELQSGCQPTVWLFRQRRHLRINQ